MVGLDRSRFSSVDFFSSYLTLTASRQAPGSMALEAPRSSTPASRISIKRPDVSDRKSRDGELEQPCRTCSSRSLTVAGKTRRRPQQQNLEELFFPTCDDVRPAGPSLQPFNTWPIAPTPDVSRMAQYFAQVWAPEHGPSFAFEGHGNPYLSLIWPFALQYDLYFEALITLCLAAWLPTQGIKAPQDRMFLYHRGNVIDKLRKRLKSPDHRDIDDATVLAVAALGTIDYILGHHNNASQHMNGIRHILRRRGEIDAAGAWGKLVNINLSCYRSLWSFLLEQKKSSEASAASPSTLRAGQLTTYLSHPFDPTVCALLSRLPQGFCDMGLEGNFSLQMINILTTLNEPFSTLEAPRPGTPPSSGTPTNTPAQGSSSPYMPPTPESPPDSATMPKSPYDSSSESTNVLSTMEDIHRLCTLATKPTEHVLCHALLSYCFILHHEKLPVKTDTLYHSVLDRLQNKILGATPEGNELERHCYLWCGTIIATGSSKRVAITSEEMDPAVMSSRQGLGVWQHLFAGFPECRDWTTLLQIMQKFFWNEGLAATVKASWTEADEFQRAQRRTSLGGSENRVRPRGLSIRDVIL